MFRFWITRDREIWPLFWPQGGAVAYSIKFAIYVFVPFGTGGILTGDFTSLWSHPDSWPFYALPFVIIVGIFWGRSAVKLEFHEHQKINELQQKLEPKFKLSLHFPRREVKLENNRARYEINICVKPTSEANVEKCTAHLVSLLKNGNTVEIGNSIPLKWSYPPEETEKTIVSGTESIVRVASSGSHGHNLRLEGIPWDRHNNLFEDPATYRFKAVVDGNNVPKSIEIDVKWNGQWNQIEANEVING